MPEAKQRHLTSVRRLAAIMFTDIVGYTAMMSKDEQATLSTLRTNRETHKKLILEYGGQFLKEMGDGVLASFENSSDAVICAAAIQKASVENKIELRIGLHMGEVTFENNDVFGDGVNIASRIQPLAEPNQILISETVHHNVQNKPGITTTLVGPRELKNVLKPMVIYIVEVEDNYLTPGVRIEKKKAVIPLILALAAITIVAVGMGSYWFGLSSQDLPEENPVFRYDIDLDTRLSRTGRHSIAFSPDGKYLCYVSDGQLFLKAMDDTGNGLSIIGVDDPRGPTFSPDGNWIAYEDPNNQRLMKVSVRGGSPQQVCVLDAAAMGINWYEEGIIFGQDRAFYKVNPDAGIPEKIYPQDSVFSSPVWNPQLLPDNRILFNQYSEEGSFWDVRLGHLESNKEPEILLNRGTDARYLESGHISFLDNESLKVVKFDESSGSIVGTPLVLTTDPIHNVGSLGKSAQYTFNGHGALVYYAPTGIQFEERHLVWVDFSGKTEIISREPRDMESPTISRNGAQIVVQYYDESAVSAKIAIYNPELGTATDFLTEGSGGDPVWYPDNVSITYKKRDGDSIGVYMKPVDLSYPEKLLFKMASWGWIRNWSNDGRYLIFVGPDGIGYFDNTDSTIHYLDFIDNEENFEGRPNLSPDGKWVSYMSITRDGTHLYVAPFPGPGQAQRISIDNGYNSVWALDMKAIYFVGEDANGQNVSKADIQTVPRFSSREPEVLFYGNFTTYFRGLPSGSFGIHPDGDRFLMLEAAGAKSEDIEYSLKVVVNWRELLDNK